MTAPSARWSSAGLKTSRCHQSTVMNPKLCRVSCNLWDAMFFLSGHLWTVSVVFHSCQWPLGGWGRERWNLFHCTVEGCSRLHNTCCELYLQPLYSCKAPADCICWHGTFFLLQNKCLKHIFVEGTLHDLLSAWLHHWRRGAVPATVCCQRPQTEMDSTAQPSPAKLGLV